MKLEFRSHYWPATPHLREIKIVVDGEVIYSLFMTKEEIWDLSQQMRYLNEILSAIVNNMDRQSQVIIN